MDDPTFVLVRPQMGENIGAAARAMLNFGLEHMTVVAPRDGWPNQAAVAMASGAGRVLDQARLVGTTVEAVSARNESLSEARWPVVAAGEKRMEQDGMASDGHFGVGR